MADTRVCALDVCAALAKSLFAEIIRYPTIAQRYEPLDEVGSIDTQFPYSDRELVTREIPAPEFLPCAL
jgi:hypothetical protein